MDRDLMPEEWAANKNPHNGAARGLATWAAVLLSVGAVMMIVGLVGDTDIAWALYAGAGFVALAVQMLIGLSLFWAWRYEHRQLSRLIVPAVASPPPAAVQAPGNSIG